MGTKKGQVRKTARRAYKDTGSQRAKSFRNDLNPMEKVTKWTSKAEAKRWGNHLSLTQGYAAFFQIKQKGRKWAVFAKKK